MRPRPLCARVHVLRRNDEALLAAHDVRATSRARDEAERNLRSAQGVGAFEALLATRRLADTIDANSAAFRRWARVVRDYEQGDNDGEQR